MNAWNIGYPSEPIQLGGAMSAPSQRYSSQAYASCSSDTHVETCYKPNTEKKQVAKLSKSKSDVRKTKKFNQAEEKVKEKIKKRSAPQPLPDFLLADEDLEMEAEPIKKSVKRVIKPNNKYT